MLKAAMTSVYGEILIIDSTKKNTNWIIKDIQFGDTWGP